jgi:hypothetical protein
LLNLKKEKGSHVLFHISVVVVGVSTLAASVSTGRITAHSWLQLGKDAIYLNASAIFHSVEYRSTTRLR